MERPVRLLLAVLSGLAHAAALDEDEAVRLAWSRDADVAVAAAEVAGVRAGIEAERAWDLPRVRVAGLRSDRLGSGAASESPWARASVGLLWTPPRPRGRAATRAVHAARLDVALREEEAVHARVAREVRVAHRAARALQALLALQDEELFVRRNRHAWTERQVSLGLATQADALRRRLEVLEAEEARDTLLTGRDSRVRAVVARLGASPHDPLPTLIGGLGPCPAEGPLVQADDPDLAAARAEAAEVAARVAHVRAEARPWVDDVLATWVTADGDDPPYAALRADVALPTAGAARIRGARAESDAAALRADAVGRDALLAALDARDGLARWGRAAARAREAADALDARQAEVARGVAAGVLDEGALAELSLSRLRWERRGVEALAACDAVTARFEDAPRVP
jgi:hypothetical protein